MKILILLLSLSLFSSAQTSFAEYTPDSIYTAARIGDLERIKDILNSGINQNMLDNTLGAAVVGNHPEIVTYLVQQGADINHFSSFNTPLLNSAIMYNFDHSALALIEAGADVEMRGFRRIEYNLNIEYNWTPLMCAARQGNRDIVQSLLDHDADPTEKGWSHSPDDIETPADVAAYSGHLAILKLLLKNHAEISPATLFKTVRGGHTETFKYLLSKEKNLNRIGSQRKTLLMEASWWGRLDMVKYLLRKGADPSFVGPNNQTALIEILSNREIQQSVQKEIVKQLLRKGADVHFKTETNLTALSLAQKYKRTEIIPLLRKAGAQN